MGKLLQNAKKCIASYFRTVMKALLENKYPPNIFKLQMAFYRNYTSGMKILEFSKWTGADNIEELD